MDIYFVSSNQYKQKEVRELLASDKYTIKSISPPIPIVELQSKFLEEIVNDKVLKAFDLIHRPVIVEHTSLYLKELNELPGGLTQIFWDSLEAEKFSDLYGNMNAVARTIVAFCDGKTIKTFDGEIKGIIANKPSGNRDFQWDCVFQPVGSNKTFSDMGEEKNRISMRRNALDKLKRYLEDYYVTL